MAEQRTQRKTDRTREAGDGGLSGLTVAELRKRASGLGIHGVHDLHKDELVAALDEALRDRGAPKPRGEDEAGGVRTGERTSKSVGYSQEVRSPDDEPERPGRSLVTTSHDVIRQWAEERDAKPATIEGTRHGDHLGVLRLDFPGYGGGEDLRHVGWDEWFDTFDRRRLNFLYQEKRSDGSPSNFFRLESPDREDG
ncbi:hypothetical protein [Saccharothrix australiensis]|uniref:Rho termination factor-like protein n=1 Tax=Saccharothrix australiensis TaxID=2072 RepID=A0A495W0R6_9PSEU|nr:hypothetical protein [Saccharothrix australiensis]RKT55291.1 hypothetical protein C8E97_3952 [Saccharothrix australiensis]